MLRGYYTVASGLITQEKKLNTYANNIANASTVGYKKDNLIAGTFGEHLAVRMNKYQGVPTNPIGPGVYMQIVDEKYTVHDQGTFEFTQRPLDMAVAGDGYFVINQNEEEYLTRDGQFSLDEEGYLVLPGFGRVMGEGGEIQIGTSNFTVDRAGYVYAMAYDAEEGDEAAQIDRLLIAAPDDLAAMVKADSGLYTADGYAAVDYSSTQILQGTLERSNVNMSEEMTRVMASQRSLQTCSQIVKMYDDLAEKITTQISRV